MRTAVFLNEENKNIKPSKTAQQALQWYVGKKYINNTPKIQIPSKFSRPKGVLIRRSVYLPNKYAVYLEDLAAQYKTAKHRLLTEIVKKYLEEVPNDSRSNTN